MDERMTKEQLIKELESLRRKVARLEARQSSDKRGDAQAFQEARDKLEERVRKRTADLSKANKQLKQEIAEHKATAEALRLSERWFSLIFQSSPVAMNIARIRDGAIIDVNESCLRKWGRSREEVVGRRVLDLGILVRPKEFEREAQGTLEKEGMFNGFETQIHTRSGEILDDFASFAIIDVDGEPCILSGSQDITPLKRAEEALRQSEARFAQIFRTNVVAVNIARLSDGVILDANDRSAQMRGYSREEMVGQTVESLGLLEEAEAFEKKVQPVLGKEGVYHGFETQIRSKSGEIRNILASFAIIELDGEPCILSAAQDITPLKQAQDALRQAEESLRETSRLASIGELAAGVAHQINNPLNSVMGFTQLLMQENVPQHVLDDLEKIHAEGTRASKVVENLLSFARKQKTEKSYISLLDVVERALELKSYDLMRSGVKVNMRFPGDLPNTMADDQQMIEVMLNIINNAERAITSSQAGGQISIAGSRSADKLTITISDDGPGIAPERLGKIYDPFFTTKEVGEGTGLGLSICYGIIQQHGGSLRVKSPPGQGATFRIELPILAPEKATESRASEPKETDVTARQVLVVDDESNVRDLISKALSGEGHELDVAEDGQEAWRKLQSKVYDCVLVDLMMPGMSGQDLYRRIESSDREAAKRVIVMTGDTFSPNSHEFLSSARIPTLKKPFSLEELRRQVLMTPIGDQRSSVGPISSL